jgi:hypothetical protein
MTAHTNRDKALEVYRLANDLYHDLIVAARGHKLFSPLIDEFAAEKPAALFCRWDLDGYISFTPSCS